MYVPYFFQKRKKEEPRLRGIKLVLYNYPDTGNNIFPKLRDNSN